MKFYIFIKPESKRSVQSAKLACKRFAKLGIECVSCADNALLLGKSVDVVEPKCSGCDAIAVIGGDGTMLGASKLAIELGLPLFGINSGRVGFLCAFDSENIGEITLEDINSLRLSRRALLEARFGNEVCYAVNEVTVNKVSFSKTVEFDMLYGSKNLGRLRADGVIVSTPTGSTGYSLSAGGPITDPSLRAIIVTPICAHSLFSRSHVLAGESPVRIVPAKRFENALLISIDGEEYIECESGGEITVSLSERTLSLLTNDKRDFYDVLYEKMSERG